MKVTDPVAQSPAPVFDSLFRRQTWTHQGRPPRRRSSCWPTMSWTWAWTMLCANTRNSWKSTPTSSSQVMLNNRSGVMPSQAVDWYACLALISVLEMASVNMVIVTDIFWRNFWPIWFVRGGYVVVGGEGGITDEICAMDKALNDSVLFFYCEMYMVKLSECCYP